MKKRGKVHLSEGAFLAVINEIAVFAQVEKMDNKELLWRCMNTPFWRRLGEMPLNDMAVTLIAELEKRMYPEYDGDNVEFMPWGWKTPQGDIRYK
jgi:hypothetical protein